MPASLTTRMRCQSCTHLEKQCDGMMPLPPDPMPPHYSIVCFCQQTPAPTNMATPSTCVRENSVCPEMGM